jgi:hypothetical protein
MLRRDLVRGRGGPGLLVELSIMEQARRMMSIEIIMSI